MRFFDIVQEARRALQAHRLRSLLTILGIVIGVFAVSMMLALGQGIQSLINNEIQAFSQGDITIQASEGKLHGQDLAWLRNQTYTKSAIGYIDVATSINIDGKIFEPRINFINGPFNEVRKIQVIAGEDLDWDNHTRNDFVVVVDSLFEKRYKENVGRPVYPGTLNISGNRYTVIGVISTGSSGFQFGDGNLYLPFALSYLQFDKQNYDTIAVNIHDKNRFSSVSAHIQSHLNVAYGFRRDSQDRFFVESNQAFAQQEQKINFYLTLFLGAIGGISLLIGGIGTMNMMLTTVTERTREIGVRKAIGAYDRDITNQILTEAIFLTTIGGLLGLLTTTLIVLMVNTALTNFFPEAGGFVLTLNPFVFIVSIFVSMLIGVIFGWSPARQASRLPVVQALQSD